MNKPNFARQFTQFYPADAPPAERVRIARREIALHVSSLKSMLTNLSQELKRLEKSPWPGLTGGELVEGFYKLSVRHFQGVVREMHEVRRAVVEHLKQNEETESNEQP